MWRVVAAVALLAPVSGVAQEATKQIDTFISAADDRYMNQQAEATLEMVSEVLTRLPPQVPEPSERRMALVALDVLFHDRFAPARPPVQEFLLSRIERAVGEIEQTKVKEGARIWKLYNHCFVVRTASVTLVFDLTRYNGLQGRQYENALVERLVKECDVLFVSHEHLDHADAEVAGLFLEAGKPVVAPDGLWPELALAPLERKAHEAQTLQLKGRKRTLQVVVYPGHQERETCLNNVVLVFTPEGLSFAHMGDQYMLGADFPWVDKVAEHHRVDVLLPNCWTFGLSRVVDGFKPKLVIPGHENELGHPIVQREPHWRSYKKLAKCAAPGLVMTWGESFHYTP